MKEFDTVFKQTKEFHRVAGVEFSQTPRQPTKEEIRLGLGLITEELVELFRDGFGLDGKHLKALEDVLCKSVAEVANIVEYNPQGTVDATGDLLVVISRLGGVLGFDVDKINQAVFKSNMSKFTKKHLVAVNSIDKYKEKGVDVYVERVGDWFVIKRITDNKILKCSTYLPPNFEEIL